jgi:hypothetical protein
LYFEDLAKFMCFRMAVTPKLESENIYKAVIVVICGLESCSVTLWGTGGLNATTA